MLSFIALLSLTLFGVIQSITITFNNNCDYKVLLSERNDTTQLVNNVLQKVTSILNSQNLDPKSSRVIEKVNGSLQVFYVFRTGCNVLGLNCDSGDLFSPCPCLGCCLAQPIETQVAFLLGDGTPWATSTVNDFYFIFVNDGYSIPVQVSPTGNGSETCDVLLCNATLDECPDNETNGFGDLRLMKENRTVGCVDPCKKRSYPQPTGTEQDVRSCKRTNFPDLKYLDMMNRKCPRLHQLNNGNHPPKFNVLDDIYHVGNCRPRLNYEVVICP